VVYFRLAVPERARPLAAARTEGIIVGNDNELFGRPDMRAPEQLIKLTFVCTRLASLPAAIAPLSLPR